MNRGSANAAPIWKQVLSLVPNDIHRDRWDWAAAAVVALGWVAYLGWRSQGGALAGAGWVLLVAEALAGAALWWQVIRARPRRVAAHPDPVERNGRRIAVVVVSAGDEQSTIPSLAAATVLSPEHFTVLVDPDDDPAMRRLAEAFGADYLAAPAGSAAEVADAAAAAAQRCRADLVALLGPGQVPSLHWLRRTLGYFGGGDEVAVVQCPVVAVDGGWRPGMDGDGVVTQRQSRVWVAPRRWVGFGSVALVDAVDDAVEASRFKTVSGRVVTHRETLVVSTVPAEVVTLDRGVGVEMAGRVANAAVAATVAVAVAAGGFGSVEWPWVGAFLVAHAARFLAWGAVGGNGGVVEQAVVAAAELTAGDRRVSPWGLGLIGVVAAATVWAIAEDARSGSGLIAATVAGLVAGWLIAGAGRWEREWRDAFEARPCRWEMTGKALIEWPTIGGQRIDLSNPPPGIVCGRLDLEVLEGGLGEFRFRVVEGFPPETGSSCWMRIVFPGLEPFTMIARLDEVREPVRERRRVAGLSTPAGPQVRVSLDYSDGVIEQGLMALVLFNGLVSRAPAVQAPDEDITKVAYTG